MKRAPVVMTIILDALGRDTIRKLRQANGGTLELPNLDAMGLGRILDAEEGEEFILENGNAYATTARQRWGSPDSVVGARGIVGVRNHLTCGLFTQGFPKEFIDELERRTGYKFFFNKMAGGMDAIVKYGNLERHLETGELILYASICDPLGQIAGCLSKIGAKELARVVNIALEISVEMNLGTTRWISRPFELKADGTVKRNEKLRHDATLPLVKPTLVKLLRTKGVWNVAVGKILDLVMDEFHESMKWDDARFVTDELAAFFVEQDRSDSNPINLEAAMLAMEVAVWTAHRPNGTHIYVNLVDFDARYGHKKNLKAGIATLMAFDKALGMMKTIMLPGDKIIVTADHGMRFEDDLGFHNLEPVPFLVYSQPHVGHPAFTKGLQKPGGLDLVDIGGYIASCFDCEAEYRETYVTDIVAAA